MKKIFTIIALLAAATSFGQYWNKVPSGTNKKLLSISFGSATTGYIGGVDSLLMKTTDGGLTWQTIPLIGITFAVNGHDVVDVDFLTATTGYITVTNHTNPLYIGAVYKTVNGGTSWSFVDAGNTAAYRTHFLSEGNGFVIGSAFFAGNVVSKISAGQPADYHSFTYSPNLFNLCVDFHDAQTGVVGDSKGHVYRTFDGGIKWDTIQATGTDTAIFAIRYLNDSTILASAIGTLIISFDHGLTWQTEVNSLTFDYPIVRSIVLSAKDSFVAAGSSMTFPEKGLIYWHDHEFNRREIIEQPLYGVAAATDSISYAVGDSGLIVTNRIAPVVGIHTPSLLASQLNIYPNPTNGLFTTKLPVNHTVMVYDVTGKLILEDNIPALQHRVDLSAFAAGYYWIDIITPKEKLGSKIVRR
jgi:photosystem II stability/assembly factor-like uncharacterized protein